MTTPYIRPCPFCGQREHLVEQLDSDASVVICQAMVDEHSACLARGPVGLQQDERGEDQPGRDEAIRLWNTWVDVAAEGVMAQQEAELERKERVIQSLKALTHVRPGSALGKSERIPISTGGQRAGKTFRAVASQVMALQSHPHQHQQALFNTIQQLRQQLAGLLGTAEGLLDCLINATEGFEGEEQVSEEDRKEYLDQFEAAQKLLDSLDNPKGGF